MNLHKYKAFKIPQHCAGLSTSNNKKQIVDVVQIVFQNQLDIKQHHF
jgi:hypothetical protein